MRQLLFDVLDTGLSRARHSRQRLPAKLRLALLGFVEPTELLLAVSHSTAPVASSLPPVIPVPSLRYVVTGAGRAVDLAGRCYSGLTVISNLCSAGRRW